jgi:DNA-binding transcriptional MocR family regulator
VYKSLQVQTIAVKMDREGVLTSHLEEILSGWDLNWRGRGRRPKVMYTVTQTPPAATNKVLAKILLAEH